MSDYKRVSIEIEPEDLIYYVDMVDIPRRDEIVTLYLDDDLVIKVGVRRVEWTGAWRVCQVGSPEVFVYVERL